ncbi:MAG: NAD(P)H-dependent oxidoreductase [Cellvibrionaceae bacterium]
MNGKILFLAGSARKESMNKKLARHAYSLALEKGADASFIDLADYPMPIYDGDLEASEGLPENAKKLKQVFIEHQGLFIASPEYNSSLSPLLKNSIDWISRPERSDEVALVAFATKIAALSATSGGKLGGLRGLVPLRMLLGNIGVDVMGSQLAVAAYGEAFDRTGNLVDASALAALDALLDKLIVRVDRFNRA